MKKFLLLVIVTLLCGNSYAQTRKNSVRRSATTTAVAKTAAADAKLKVEEEAKAKAKAEEEEKEKAKAQAAQEEKVKRDLNNMNCNFNFSSASFISNQNSSNDFVIYEVPNMQASDLKAAVYTSLSSMYKSPKDAITNLSDNMIQLEGYANGVYRTMAGSTSYGKDLLFDLVIQFKDGKVRYNRPTIKMIYSEWPLSGMARLNMDLPLSKLIDEGSSRILVENYINDLIRRINNKLKQSNNW